MSMTNEMKEKENYFYVVDSGSNSNQHMFSDIRKMDNARQLSYVFKIKNNFLRILNKIHMSTKINKIINLPLKKIWDKYYVMNEKINDHETVKWVIMSNWSICRFGLSYLKYLEKLDDYKLVLLYLDPLSAVPEFYMKSIRNVKFDMIYSFDKSDCEKYGWVYTTNLYSKTELPENNNPENDVYYIGLDKGRSQQVENIYYMMTEQGIKCDFIIIAENGKTFDNGKGLRYLNHRIDYSEVLQGVNNSRCIMEIVQNGQSGMTMRPYEAIFYNKKLLTNNRNIKNMDFYRPDYMMVFSSDEDISIDFLKDQSTVDYEYHNQYSPINWVKNIPIDYKRKVSEPGM